MVIGDAPTLSIVRYAYGDSYLYDWLNIYLLDVSTFYGLESKTAAYQIDSISHTIFQFYSHLKVTEIMLFFAMMKGGMLRSAKDENEGKMYGSFNGQVVMDSLSRFMKERSMIIDKHINEEQKALPQPLATQEFIKNILGKTFERLGEIQRKKKAEEDERKNKIIREHNRQFLEMLAKQQQIDNEANH